VASLNVPAARASADRAASSGVIRVKEIEEELRQVYSSVVLGLNQLQDLRDVETGCHSTRLAEWGVRVAVELGLHETYQRNVEVACLLHDLGKIGVPDAILHKAGPLTPAERDVMNLHPEYGWAVLRLFPDLHLASLFALHHHEKMDGSGYPGRLCGEEIPMGARIVAVVDAFDAMVSDRCYRGGVSIEQAAGRLITDAGTHFDPDVVRYFVPLALQGAAEVARVVEPGRIVEPGQPRAGEPASSEDQ
jgi:HD-GYP domain-containing protein (c-di-GMP phosphodiesterase class II)